MPMQDRLMSWWRVCLFSMALAACTKPNPRSCQDGTCGEPAFPVCDVDGSLGGEPETCIAVECTPGELESCRGDSERRCNADGTNYDVTRCERGCDEAADGCRLCDPNETVCANGRIQRCDSSGVVVEDVACPLGCLDDMPVCRGYYLSNDLTQYLDGATSPPELDLSAGGVIDTATGTITNQAQVALPVVTHLRPANGGAPIRVFVARKVRLGNVVVRASGLGSTPSDGGPALAILALDDIVVEGRLSLQGELDARDRSAGGLGGTSFGSCIGGPASYFDVGGSDLWAAGGGGAHASAGGSGGNIGIGTLMGGRGGLPSGDATLVPLRGGCHGSGGQEGGQGGGAVQLSSLKRVVIAPDAFINANGAPGNAYIGGPSATEGAGAGGGILLEAPVVEVAAGARLLVNGGPAGSISEPAVTTSLTSAPSPGGRCTGTAVHPCGDAGGGASKDGPATSGQNITYTSAADEAHSGGGGGGLGYIRINTPPNGLDTDSTAIMSGSLSYGMLRLRP